MTAAEIKELAAKNADKLPNWGPEVYLKFLQATIKRQAERGRTRVKFPFDQLEINPPTPEVAGKVYEQMQKDGYRVDYNSDTMKLYSISWED